MWKLTEAELELLLGRKTEVREDWLWSCCEAGRSATGAAVEGYK